ncbi:MAG: hypothetical protein COV59_02430 [Candidatus Magasanikbacteria bacterium CG11_big_fil_rev_8_21_14_0_20_39_34]|uniref:Uncharacterized protein n=1 Tax=Candidatus Magasanikbacteria bacterium CG11_big_fil_rev_8_21_14_0_20_39_34 TaxID=1974653 RepID=A0A2H0N559_9BACT|nr:MAG: hypothetical protein COV59_02430 [Candidatus Magasanikbacteria bacterium CG11_big_fil_rev_8_21_14_0_20_39_34]
MSLQGVRHDDAAISLLGRGNSIIGVYSGGWIATLYTQLAMTMNLSKNKKTPEAIWHTYKLRCFLRPMWVLAAEGKVVGGG